MTTGSSITLAQWQALEQKILTDINSNNHIASYSMLGRTFSYKTMKEQYDVLKDVQNQIAKLQTGGGFLLARMANI